MNSENLWLHLAARANLTLSDDQRQSFHAYLDLLLEANQRMNLTRIADRPAAEIQHVGDALTLLPFLPAPPGSPAPALRIIDVGSGGGVPGIPLAIARPDAQITLLESTRKKAAFIQEAANKLNLSNITVLPDRAESVGQGPHRESFDIATARAVGALDFLVEWCLPLVKKGGKMLAMKGARITEELPPAQKAIRLLGGGDPTTHPVELPGTEHHVIVEIPKIGKTDTRYPRDPTYAKGKPIR